MDATTMAAKMTWEVGKAAYAGWRWYEKWQKGKVLIDRPKNNQSVTIGSFTFEGWHEGATGMVANKNTPPACPSTRGQAGGGMVGWDGVRSSQDRLGRAVRRPTPISCR
jgi:hypothetical protein